jgi:hypothetical protein
MGSSGEYTDSAIPTGGPVMNVRLALALLPLLFLGSPVHAQSPCSECLKAAEKDLKKCLDNAISADDKISCEENRQAGMKVCVRGDCTIERDQQATRDTRNEQETPNRPGLTPYMPTKIEWLALDVRSQLQQNVSADSLFFLSVVHVDHETLLIVVRYPPTVNREMMRSAVDSARRIIMTTAKSHGWESWVKIREQVEMSPSKK